MVFAATLFFIAVATLLFLGWGWAFLRLLRLERGTWPSTVAVGLAVVVFLGGILNLARLAVPAAFVVLTGIGVLLAILAFRDGLTFDLPPMAVLILVAVVMIFTIATQLPPSIYNFHDDYQKYFAYPVRMLETGTVFGSSLSAMGLQTLGAQAFLDGFVVAFFPIVDLNGVDAVFGFFLCLVLASQFAKIPSMTLVGVASVVFINPQYVNISTLFCGSALIMATAILEDAVALGLIYAALIAMKPVFAVFVALHLLALAAGGVGRVVRTGFACALFLSPWVLVHAPNYLAALRIHHSAPTPIAGEIDTEKINILSLQALPYGSTAANYTLLVIAFAVCGVICWRAKPMALKPLACCVSAIASFLIFVYVLGPMQYGYNHGLRYFVPVAIGLAPVIFGWTPRRGRWLPLLAALIPLAAFAPSLISRVSTEYSTHSAVSYWWLADDPDYVAYNKKVLTGTERRDVKALQDLVPADEPILAWINTPFYLDYKRNRIIDIDTAGIGVPWAELPAAKYLIWDYAGFATPDQDEFVGRARNVGAGERKDSLMTLDFINWLDTMVEKGVVLFDNGEVKVVRLF